MQLISILAWPVGYFGYIVYGGKCHFSTKTINKNKWCACRSLTKNRLCNPRTALDIHLVRPKRLAKMADPMGNNAAPNQGMQNWAINVTDCRKFAFSVQRTMKMEFPSQTANSSYPFRPLPSQANASNRPKMSLPNTPKNAEIVNERTRWVLKCELRKLERDV